MPKFILHDLERSSPVTIKVERDRIKIGSHTLPFREFLAKAKLEKSVPVAPPSPGKKLAQST